LHVPKPSFLVKPWMAEIAWRAALLGSLLSGKSTLISKNYARVSQRATRYSNHKIKSFLNFEFIPVQKSIEYTAKAYLNQHS
jgi:dihydroflavonol-4-reductase